MANSPRATIQRRIDKIRDELGELHAQVGGLFGDIEAREFAVAELEAVKKALPEEEGDERQPDINLRKGSDASTARDVLREVRKPLHVDALLAALGKEITKKTRASLAGQLAFYARKKQIFEKTGPNEFGLLEWTDKSVKMNPDGSFVVGNPMSETFEIHINGHKSKASESPETSIDPAPLSLADED